MKFIHFIRKTPFTLVLPYLWTTVVLNLFLLVASTVLIWASSDIPPVLGMIGAVVFTFHTLLTFLVAALEIFSPETSFVRSTTPVLLFGLFFLYFSMNAAFANVYGAANRLQDGAFVELNSEMGVADQMLRSYYLSADVFTGIATNWIIPDTRFTRIILYFHAIVSNFVFLFIIGNMTDLAIRRVRHVTNENKI